MTTPATLVRLSDPSELAAALPVHLGFVPHESLVVLCLHEPRGRLGLTLRVDLPAPELHGEVAEEVGRRVRRAGATRAVLVVFTEQAQDREELAHAVGAVLGRVVLADALLVRAGRVRSLLCDSPQCCPPDGVPVAVGQAQPAVQALHARAVLAGRVVRASRQEVAAELVPPPRTEAAVARLEAALAGSPDVPVLVHRRSSLALWRQVVQRFRRPPAVITDDEAARLVAAVRDPVLRDEIARWTLRAQEPLRALLLELCRRTPRPYDGTVCALLALTSYAGGDGTGAGIALERALASDPDHRLALLLDQALRIQLPPEALRRTVLGITRGGPGATGRGRRRPPSRG